MEAGMPKSYLTLRFLAEPIHVNFGGKVHGGSVMKWLDEAAYACASGYCGCYCVTVSVSGLRFVAPIRIGNLVEIRARVLLTGRTSVTIGLEVTAVDVRSHERTLATRCLMTFVAMDENAKPVLVPEWRPETPQQIRWAELAQAARVSTDAVEAQLAEILAS